jgi:hypothetical protein
MFVGLHEQMESGLLTVYPNPGNGMFTIELDKKLIREVWVIDSRGRQVLRANANASPITVGLDGEENGCYMLLLTDESGLIMRKSIIKIN